MSLSLISRPTVGYNNILPGFKPIQFEFKREDIAIVSIESGAGGKVLAKIAGDKTGALAIGNFVYINSSGATFEYDSTGEVIDITYNAPNTEVTIDIDFIETTSADGYMNYLQNYYLEMKVVNPDNADIDLLGFSIQEDGKPNGVIKIDTGIIVDTLTDDIFSGGGVITDERVKYKVKYREVYDSSSNSFTEDAESIICIFATDDIERNEFNTPFIVPKLWNGYNWGVGFYYNDEENPADSIDLKVDELDINQRDLVTDTILRNFPVGSYGLLWVDSNDFLGSINSDTVYLKFKAEDSTSSGEFEPSEFSNEFNI